MIKAFGAGGCTSGSGSRLTQHGPLILAFSFSAVAFTWLLRSPEGWPSPKSVVVAFISCLIFFLQLRIADEFKDAEEDARFRPYRAVPRGLVTLGELRGLFLLGAAVQVGLALWLDARLLALLFVTWTYQALMGKEFFVGQWLRGKHVTYLVSHMAIMPLVDLYATSTDWLAFQGSSSVRAILVLVSQPVQWHGYRGRPQDPKPTR